MEKTLCVLLIFIPSNLSAVDGGCDGQLGANVSSLLLQPHRYQRSCLSFIFASFANRFFLPRPLNAIGCVGKSASIYSGVI